MSASNFRELNDAQLAKLSDEELVAHIVRARAAGRADAARLAAQILAFKHQDRVYGWFHNSLESAGAVEYEELAAITIRDAIRWAESFAGTTDKEFRAAVFRIARRRRVDFLRRKRIETTSFAWAGSEDAEEREFGSGDPQAAIEYASAFNQAFEELRKDSHKLVVLLNMHGFSHREIAEKVTSHFGDTDDDPMSENNVSKILSRFNKRLDELLQDD